MNKSGFSTGQLLGMVGLNYASLYRYVKTFPEFFGAEAQQHKRGRRWTTADLQTVQAIRYLNHEHVGEKAIRKKLAAGWRPQIIQNNDQELVSRLVDGCLAMVAEAKQLVAVARKESAAAKREIWTIDQDLTEKNKDLRENFEALRLTLQKKNIIPPKPIWSPRWVEPTS
jgi:hypothetical protein